MNTVVFLDLLVIGSSKPWPGCSACFKAGATDAVCRSQYDILCRRTALQQPASVNTEQKAAHHFKARLWGGGVVLIWEFYLWNYCRARVWHLNIHYSKYKPEFKKTSLCFCSRLSKLCLTFLQGFEDTSKEALKARLCWVVRMVRGLLGLLGSFPSSPFPWPPMPFSGLMSNSSSSLFSAERKRHHFSVW